MGTVIVLAISLFTTSEASKREQLISVAFVEVFATKILKMIVESLVDV